MTRVHLVPKGTMPPMPELVKGDVDRKLPGGYCPRGMRTQWSNMAGQHRSNPKPKQYASPMWYQIEREFKRGMRAADSAI